MPTEQPLGRRLIMTWSKRVNAVLFGGAAVTVLIVGTRCFSHNESVKVQGINVPLDAVGLILVAVTGLHVFVGLFFRKAILDFLGSNADNDQKIGAYEDVVAEGGPYVSVTVRRVPAADRRLARMSFSDASTWLACGAALLAFVAVLPWWIDGGLRWKGLGQALGAGGIAVGLVVANWLVGGAWATALSRLGDPASDVGDLEWEGSDIPPGCLVAILAVPVAAVAVIAFWAWLF